MGADAPGRVKVGKWANEGKKKAKASATDGGKAEQQILVTLISTGMTALYGSIALWRQESHWNLQPNESRALALQLHQCLETLPQGVYAEIVKQIENFAPWIGLAITAGAITLPRIERSRVPSSANAASGKAAANSGRPDSADEFPQEFDPSANPFVYGAANSYHGGSPNDR